jgi:hypothetical protein
MITYKPLPIEDNLVIPYLNTNNVWHKNSIIDFKEKYNKWITSSKNFIVYGLDAYEKSITDGVTGAFYNFEHAFKEYNTVVFKGEYPFHVSTNIKTIEKVSDLEHGNKLIISYPYSANGEKYLNFDDIIDVCDSLDIPVLIDMAYFGIAKVPSINVDRPCIKMVAFSLSKTFATGKCKIGLCYHRNIKNTPMQVLNDYEYVNHVSINIHMPIISNFTADYMFDKYKDKQEWIAKVLGLTASSTVFLCYSYSSEWDKFSRNKLVNRIGIAHLLQNENLTSEDIINAKRVENPWLLSK